jgi:hypothetical protein
MDLKLRSLRKSRIVTRAACKGNSKNKKSSVQTDSETFDLRYNEKAHQAPFSTILFRFAPCPQHGVLQLLWTLKALNIAQLF